MKSALYTGTVLHRRLKPVEHRFAYKVFSMLLDLDELDELDKRLTLFSRNSMNVFSFFDRDFGVDNPASLSDHVRQKVERAGLDASGSIQLLCYPRIFGYAFNPLAVYYCHDRYGRLSAILYEVSSTFGERHSYLAPVKEKNEIIHQQADKLLHVSPFMDMDMTYFFRLNRPNENLALLIRQVDGDGPILHASFIGERQPLTNTSLRRVFFAYPLMTLKVIAGIHWEAVRLLAKGMKLRPGPRAPVEDTSNATDYVLGQ